MDYQLKIGLGLLTAVFICVIVYFGATLHSLSSVSFESFELSALENVSLEGFEIGGKLGLKNNGLMSVDIKEINYSVELEGKDKSLAVGKIDSGTLVPGKIVFFDLHSRIKWSDLVDSAADLVVDRDQYALIRGRVTVGSAGFFSAEIPFEQRVSLKPLIDQYVELVEQEAKKQLKEYLGVDVLPDDFDLNELIRSAGNIASGDFNFDSILGSDGAKDIQKQSGDVDVNQIIDIVGDFFN